MEKWDTYSEDTELIIGGANRVLTSSSFGSILESIVPASSELVTSSSLAVVTVRGSVGARGKKCATDGGKAGIVGLKGNSAGYRRG